ncbi:hypothetical protein D3C85_1273780 [compost metagenome]
MQLTHEFADLFTIDIVDHPLGQLWTERDIQCLLQKITGRAGNTTELAVIVEHAVQRLFQMLVLDMADFGHGTHYLLDMFPVQATQDIARLTLAERQ